jgi:hypothetical protein
MRVPARLAPAAGWRGSGQEFFDLLVEFVGECFGFQAATAQGAAFRVFPPRNAPAARKT